MTVPHKYYRTYPLVKNSESLVKKVSEALVFLALIGVILSLWVVLQ